MIPKVIFQTSKYKLESYVKDMILELCPGWTHLHFTDDDIITFFRDNPLEEFPDIESKFHNFSCGAHRADLFRYYFLYLNGGVFLDSDAMLENNISTILQDYKLVFVQSPIHPKPHIFNGFICCEPRHEILFNALSHMYNFNVKNPPYHIFCEELYKIVFKFVDSRENSGVACFSESLNHDRTTATTIDPDTRNKVLCHYFRSKIVPKKQKNATIM